MSLTFSLNPIAQILVLIVVKSIWSVVLPLLKIIVKARHGCLSRIWFDRAVKFIIRVIPWNLFWSKPSSLSGCVKESWSLLYGLVSNVSNIKNTGTHGVYWRVDVTRCHPNNYKLTIQLLSLSLFHVYIANSITHAQMFTIYIANCDVIHFA